MSGKIPNEFIQNLLTRIDIADVIGDRIPLKRASSGLHKANCPFHDEKTPSFTVFDKTQTYYCFGCTAHGSAISFLMDYDHLSYPEAIEELARRIGETVPRESSGQYSKSSAPDHRSSDYDLMEKVSRQFAHWLKHHPQSETAKAYLKNRGLSGKTAFLFGIGFAPPGWNALEKKLGADHLEALIRNGLVIRNEQNKVYDRFRDRIMFPIRDRRGRVIGFGGRVLSPEQEPKYLNSPETDIFYKGQELYGLHEALDTNRRPPRLLVVEGYMDVIALAQADIRYAVATLGTAITPHHIQRLFKTTSRVIFCFDGDTAGRKAAWKALEVSLKTIRSDQRVEFMFLPEGEDPDTLVRKLGTAQFETKINQGTPLSQFFFSHLGDSLNLSISEDLAILVNKATPLLNEMPPSELRTAMIDELASITRYKFGQTNELERRILSAKTPSPHTQSQTKQPIRQRTPVRVAIALLLNQPELALTINAPERWNHIEVAGIKILVQLLLFFRSQPDCTLAVLLETWPNADEKKIFEKLAYWDHLVPDDGAAQEFRDIVTHFEQLLTAQEIYALEKKMRLGTLLPNEMEHWKKLIAKNHSRL